MRDFDSVYVNLIDGTTCSVPVHVKVTGQNSYLLLANGDFDPEDKSMLFEYVPGDEVRANQSFMEIDGKSATILVATELVASLMNDADYWHVLFAVAAEKQMPNGLSDEQLRSIGSRILAEVKNDGTWHYPRVVDWAKRITRV